MSRGSGIAGVEVVMAEGDDGVFSLLQAHGWKREAGFDLWFDHRF